MEQTRWYQVVEEAGLELILNDSWSGSTIGYTGYYNRDCSKSSSFIYRLKQLTENGFFINNQIDTVFVFGGTNDSWANAPLGEPKTEGIERSDLYFVLPAINHLANRLREAQVARQVVFIGNSEIKSEILGAMRDACERCGFQYIPLSDIDKIAGHPTELGMEQICRQILEAMN